MDAIAAIFSAVIGVLGALLVSFLQRKFNATQKQLDQIHVLVNSRLTEALEDIRQLKSQLIIEKRKTGEIPPVV